MSPRALRAAGPVILAVSALVVLIWALAFGGGAAPLAIGDPGPVARWGLPTVKLVVNLSAAGMVGALVTALYALRAGEREFDVALDVASISAAIFTVSAAVTGFLTFVDAFNPAIDAGPEFGAQLGRFVIETEVGRTWLITTCATSENESTRRRLASALAEPIDGVGVRWVLEHLQRDPSSDVRRLARAASEAREAG